jgi:RNA polymerase-binding transcription factor DksA
MSEYFTQKLREHEQLLKNSEDRNETLLQRGMLTMEDFEAAEEHRASLRRIIGRTRATINKIEVVRQLKG